MKKILGTLLAFVLAFTICGPTTIKAADVTLTLYSSVYPQMSTVFDCNGGTFNIAAVTSDNSYWTASTDCDWISLNRTTGRAQDPNLTVTLAANPLKTLRQGQVIVAAGGVTKSFMFQENGNINGVTSVLEEATDLYIAQTSVTLDANGENVFILCGSNEAWTAKSDSSWLYFVDPNTSHGAADSGMNMYIGANANTTGAGRVGHVIVTAGDVTKTITFTQAAQ